MKFLFSFLLLASLATELKNSYLTLEEYLQHAHGSKELVDQLKSAKNDETLKKFFMDADIVKYGSLLQEKMDISEKGWNSNSEGGEGMFDEDVPRRDLLDELAQTYENEPCTGKCGVGGGADYTWCYDSSWGWHSWDYCSTPDSTATAIKGKPKCGSDADCDGRKCADQKCEIKAGCTGQETMFFAEKDKHYIRTCKRICAEEQVYKDRRCKSNPNRYMVIVKKNGKYESLKKDDYFTLRDAKAKLKGAQGESIICELYPDNDKDCAVADILCVRSPPNDEWLTLESQKEFFKKIEKPFPTDSKSELQKACHKEFLKIKKSGSFKIADVCKVIEIDASKSKNSELKKKLKNAIFTFDVEDDRDKEDHPRARDETYGMPIWYSEFFALWFTHDGWVIGNKSTAGMAEGGTYLTVYDNWLVNNPKNMKSSYQWKRASNLNTSDGTITVSCHECPKNEKFSPAKKKCVAAATAEGVEEFNAQKSALRTSNAGRAKKGYKKVKSMGDWNPEPQEDK